MPCCESATCLIREATVTSVYQFRSLYEAKGAAATEIMLVMRPGQTY